VATGLFVAFVIPYGQMLAAFFLAAILRGARGLAALVTWVTNPITMPIFYTAQCYLGSIILGRPLSFPQIQTIISGVVENPSLRLIGKLSADLIASFLIGGIVFGLLSAGTGYVCITTMVRYYRKQMERRKAGKRGLPINGRA